MSATFNTPIAGVILAINCCSLSSNLVRSFRW
ncbi:MAG TPA: hypothetical protein VMU26_31230 [Candidatus Polarisedimenticolia bacterium]|nr:hypothetical protein [Candidatus Polarisedimenticolia bacterium]